VCNLRRFLFHTALASGAPPGFPPLAALAARGVESRRPLPLFATNRGFCAEDEADKVAGVEVEAAGPFSPSFEGAAAVEAFDARKVLFTETALKEVGLLTAEADLR
jgi:hypothetical protein